MTDLDDFVSQNAGEQIADHSGNFLGECVSLVKQYADQVQGIPDADTVLQAPNGARDLYERFNWNGKMSQYYDKIPASQPRWRGDIVVWGDNMGSYGDTAVALNDGNLVFGQLGTPVFQPAKVRNETKPPLGYLRLKENKEEEVIKNEDEADLLYRSIVHEAPSKDWLKSAVGQPWTIVAGKLYQSNLWSQQNDAITLYPGMVNAKSALIKEVEDLRDSKGKVDKNKVIDYINKHLN